MSNQIVMEYGGLRLVVDIVEDATILGDRDVGWSEKVVGIDRVLDGPLDDDALDVMVDASWYEAWCDEAGKAGEHLEPDYCGLEVDRRGVHDGRALGRWLAAWGGDTLIAELDEMNRARLRGERERAERGDL